MLAIPDHASLYPMKLTPVPLNANVARAPASMAITEEPPLFTDIVFEYHVPEYDTLLLFCSVRADVDVGLVDVEVVVVGVVVVVGGSELIGEPPAATSIMYASPY